ncbi:MAG TPA: threonine/serine exporter [Firmicutes bacterium]|nr:threonine/serine exporter [Bacillota bacterium]
MNFHELINVATLLGKALLENGAEIYRVEESVERMALAYGAKEVDVYAVPTTILVTITTQDDECLSKAKRIHTRSTNLDKVERLNDLSRRIVMNKPSLNTVRDELSTILNRPIYSLNMQIFAYALTSSTFTLFFGGNIKDALCAIFIGACIKFIGHLMDKLKTNPFFKTIILSGLTALLALMAVSLHLGDHVDKMIIGTVMNLVPGVAITNSVRDIIAGDFIAGQTKMTEAILTATCIAIGTGVILSVYPF